MRSCAVRCTLLHICKLWYSHVPLQPDTIRHLSPRWRYCYRAEQSQQSYVRSVCVSLSQELSFSFFGVLENILFRLVPVGIVASKLHVKQIAHGVIVQNVHLVGGNRRSVTVNIQGKE